MRRTSTERQTMIAKLALVRAAKRISRIVVTTDNQAALIAMLRSIEPRTVLSLIGTDAVHIHGYCWGEPREQQERSDCPSTSSGKDLPRQTFAA
jgi:hypothetical protein